MPYCMWYFTHSAEVPSFAEMSALIRDGEFGANLRLVHGAKDAWERVDLVGDEDSFAAEIYRTPVRTGQAGDPGDEKVQSFLQEIKSVKPASAVPWLRDYLQRARTIYSLRLHGVHEDWSEPVDELRKYIDDVDDDVDHLISYCEFEGWSNDMREHITWEFGRGVTGEWWMGLLIEGKWHRFQMKLGDKQQQKCFKNGQVPPGKKVIVRPA